MVSEQIHQYPCQRRGLPCRLPPMRGWIAPALVIACFCGACRPALERQPATAADGVAPGPVHPTAVGAEEFPARALEVLRRTDGSAERRNLVAGVVQRQLARSATRFGASREAGLAALTGATLLLRPADFHPDVFLGEEAALEAGANAWAQAGNEGRSLAYYSLLEHVLPQGPAREDVRGHLRALEQWTESIGRSGPLRTLGAQQRTAVDRALVEGSAARLEEAADDTRAWIRRALEVNPSELQIRSPAEREEAVEVYRAFKAGGLSLVALYLRYGDAVGALRAIDERDIARVVPDGLAERLSQAARGEPEAWAELNSFYGEAAQESQREIAVDPDLARAAAWGSAVELFRLAPHDPSGVMPLAQLLQEYGMADVSPLVLQGAFDENTDAYPLSWALALILRGMIADNDIGQHEVVRRTFASAAPLLELAERPRLRRAVRPSAARFRYAMGAMETHLGQLERARPLLEAAVRGEPDNADAWRLLAAIERQRGEYGEALKVLTRLKNLARTKGHRIEEAEAEIAAFEVYRDQGRLADGEPALRSALQDALAARAAASPGPELARAERLLARAIEHYDDVGLARRATQRAIEAARSDADELSVTLLDASRRALVLGDLRLGRSVTREAVEAELAPDDLVYVALWLMLLERRKGEPADGSAAEALAVVRDAHGWVAQLRDWGQGQLTDEQLKQAASSPVESTEAAFYVATRAAAGTELADLEAVAESPAINLIEVNIARDLLAAGQGHPELPSDIDLP